MPYKATNKHILFGVIAFLVLATAVYSVLQQEETDSAQITPITAQNITGRISENPEHWNDLNGTLILNENFWSEKIKELGSLAAYEILEKEIEPLDDYGRHLTTHSFGNALFNVEGISGIGTCDHRFGQGCFHQFFMSALSTYGKDVIELLSDECNREHNGGQAVHGCNHGMGHGVMIAFEGMGLDRAVEACTILTDSRAFYGCIDGVFMEYFTPTHVGRNKDDLPKRVFDPNKPHAPCSSLADKFQPTCYYMQASWWLQTGLDAKTAAELCRTIPGGHTETCFKALGHVFTLASHYKKDPTLRACKKIADNNSEELACRAGAHWAFSRGEEVGEILSENDKKLCEYPDQAQQTKCIQEANLIEGPIGISIICCRGTIE